MGPRYSTDGSSNREGVNCCITRRVGALVRLSARCTCPSARCSPPISRSFFEHQRDADALRMAAMPGRDHDAFHAHWQTKVLGDPAVIVRTVLCDGEVAGTINSFVASERRQVGYFFGKAFWGKGIATSALREFLEVDASRPLFAFVAKENLGSVRVLEKNGFTIVEEVVDRWGDGVTELLLTLE